MQNEKRCYVCGCERDLELHHVMSGTANRKLSTRYGLVCFLCREHHTGKTGVHTNRALKNQLEMDAQIAFEKIHGHDMWMETFRKNYVF